MLGITLTQTTEAEHCSKCFTDKTSYLRELSPYLPGDGGDKADVFLFGEVSILLMVCLVCDDFLCEGKSKNHGNKTHNDTPAKSILKRNELGGMLRGINHFRVKWLMCPSKIFIVFSFFYLHPPFRVP